ncbi:MAG: sulfurtransferase [Betaproteobacteria bacterium]|nr:sulfurtransferase [Betaproteobacteria bacterium]
MKPALPVLNISAYLFTEISDTLALREACYAQASALSLKGTVLIAEEGINLFLAGPPSAIRAFVSWLQQDPRLASITPKESWSATQPFRKLLVKVKNEIIRMNHPAIQPQTGRAPAVAAATLKRWLDAGHDDQGRPVVTLDTRNAFEVDEGSFVGAVNWRIDKFSDFPTAASQHLSELQDKTVVSFCTGGIRCEKAAIYLREQGLSEVYQLEGGILKYFEEVGNAHYNGNCFVFDERRGVNADLTPLKTEA